MPRSAVSNGLIVVKLKQVLKCQGHVFFEPVRPYIIYQALSYSKSHNKFYKDNSIKKGLSSEDMFKFSDIVETQGETESDAENISDGKEMTENVNDTRSETEFASGEANMHPLNMHRTVSNETTPVSEIPNIIDEENVIIAPGQGKTPVLILSDKFCEEQTFPYLLPKGKFSVNASRLNNKKVLVARHFQYKVGVFFKDVILDGPLGKTKYYPIRIEFKERGSPHVHSFIWIFNAPNIQNEAVRLNVRLGSKYASG